MIEVFFEVSENGHESHGGMLANRFIVTNDLKKAKAVYKRELNALKKDADFFLIGDLDRLEECELQEKHNGICYSLPQASIQARNTDEWYELSIRAVKVLVEKEPVPYKRLLDLVYNSISYLEDECQLDIRQLRDELGLTKKEYRAIMAF